MLFLAYQLMFGGGCNVPLLLNSFALFSYQVIAASSSVFILLNYAKSLDLQSILLTSINLLWVLASIPLCPPTLMVAFSRVTTLLVIVLANTLLNNSPKFIFITVFMNKNRNVKLIQPDSESEQYSESSQHSAEEERDYKLPSTKGKITINESKNKLYRMNSRSDDDDAIEQQSQQEDDSSDQQQGSSQSSRSHSSNESNSKNSGKGRREDNSQSEVGSDVDYIECRIQKLEKDLQKQINKHAILKNDNYEEALRPKSEKQPILRQEPIIKALYQPESKSIKPPTQLRQSLDKDKKSKSKARLPQAKVTRHPQGKTPQLKKNDSRTLKQNNYVGNNVERIERKSNNDKKPAYKPPTLPNRTQDSKLQLKKPTQKAQPRKSTQRSTNKGTSLSKQRQQILKLKNTLSSSEALKLEQQLELLKVVESIRAKLKKSINKKLKSAKQKQNHAERPRNSSYLMLQR